jgi:hypothetical protein
MTKTKAGRVWRAICLVISITIAMSAAADTGSNHQTVSTLFGTSGGNINDISTLYCCSGTLGALVQDSGGTKYILSNNHVLARSNTAAKGEDISQPGLIDNGCRIPTIVARLSAYPSLFSNVDAAIAESVAGMASTGEIMDIGTISNVPRMASIDLQVQKSGRTTGLTSGTVSSVSTNVSVNYQPRCGMGKKFKASFRNQVVVNSSTFSAGGDSGSLIVTKTSSGSPQPVALLYAGSSTTTVGNPIGEVLAQLTSSLGGSQVSFVGSSSFGAPLTSGGATSALTPQSVRDAHAAKEKWADAWMNRPGVIGVGVGLSDDRSEAAVIVYVDNGSAARPNLPERADGARVRIVLTDPFVSR